jgi:hypothetical protein
MDVSVINQNIMFLQYRQENMNDSIIPWSLMATWYNFRGG